MMTDKPRRSSDGVPLEMLLDRTHPLVKLTEQIDWSQFPQAFGLLYAEEGRRRRAGDEVCVGQVAGQMMR